MVLWRRLCRKSGDYRWLAFPALPYIPQVCHFLGFSEKSVESLPNLIVIWGFAIRLSKIRVGNLVLARTAGVLVKKKVIFVFHFVIVALLHAPYDVDKKTNLFRDGLGGAALHFVTVFPIEGHAVFLKKKSSIHLHIADYTGRLIMGFPVEGSPLETRNFKFRSVSWPAARWRTT